MEVPASRKYDKLWVGLVVGFIVPVAGFGILLTLYDQLENMDLLANRTFSETFRSRTLSLVGICMNIIPIQIFQRRYMYNAMRGLVFPTLIYIAIWIYVFYDVLFAT